MYKNHSFYDASVLNFYFKNNNIYLELEDVTNRQDEKVKGAFIFQNIKNIEIDGAPSKDIKMIYPDGEVIHLDQEEKGFILIIEWNNYNSHDSKMISYLSNCENTDWIIKNAGKG